MTDFNSPPEDSLGNVPLPKGMLARLKQLAIATDDDLDTAIRDVRVPVGLRAKLKGAVLTEADVDRALRQVPVPVRVIRDLKALPFEQPARLSRRRMALAASLLMVVGGSLWTVTAGNGWQWLMAQVATPAQPGGEEFATFDPSEPFDIGPPPGVRISLPDLSPEPQVAPSSIAEHPSQAVLPTPEIAPRPNVVETPHESIFGADAWYDRLPDLVRVPGMQRHGITPPASKSYDLLFAAARGVNPWVSPGDDKVLRTCPLPVVVRTHSYDQFRRLLENGRLPAKDELRIEEFLAAHDFRYPPPDQGPIAIRTAAGPAPFAPAGTQLLQIGVQAGPPKRGNAQPQHVVLALDVSASMRHGGRWEMVRRAVLRWLREQSPADTLSIIVFRNDAQQLVASVKSTDLEAVREKLQSVQPTGSTSVGAGLVLAYATALRTTGPDLPMRHKIVLVTDGLADLTAEATARIRGVIDSGLQSGVSLDVVDLLGGERSPAVWRDLAQAGDGRLHLAQDAQEIATALRETVAGNVGAVAEDVKLQLRFDPAAVERYRVVGHDPALVPGWTSDQMTVSLRGAQTAINLVELRLRPDVGNTVGEVELSWTDPGTSQSRTLKQRISRVQFANSYRESPLPLQWGALIAEVGEILRESPHATGTQRTLERVVALALDANPRLRERPEFAEWLSSVQQAAKVKAGRNGG